MRAAWTFLGLAVALAAAALPLSAADPLPEHTIASTGAPPYRYGGDPGRRAAWIEACLASGRRQVGTVDGGDLLYAAGAALARNPAEQGRALSVLVEASAAYPPDAADRGLVLLDAAGLQLARGDAIAARNLIDAAGAQARQPAPRDADVRTAARHALLVERWTMQGAALGVRIAEARGDLAAAADRQEELASHLDGKGDARAPRAWGRAARYHVRAGRTERALAAVDRALELTEDDAQRADLAFWRLHLLHGLLDTEGAPTLGTAWPGDDLVADVRVALRGLSGNAHVGTWLLTLASRAVTADRDEDALELYRLALRDPVLVDRARGDPDLWGGLLVAFPVALRLGRLEDAERVLEIVARVADLPPGDLDDYRLALARARERRVLDGMPPPEPDDGSEPDDAEAQPPSPHRGRLHPHGPPEEAEDPPASNPGTADPGEDESPPGSSWPLVAVFGVLGLTLACRVMAARRRRSVP